jgi:hypothetical protein
MDWISGLIGLGGLFVAALSLWLNYRDRSAMHRQIIYQKQIDAYSEIIISLIQFFNKALEFMPPSYKYFGDEAGKLLETMVFEEFTQFKTAFAKNMMFISEDVAMKILNFYALWKYFISPTKNPDHPYKDHLTEPVSDLSSAFSEVVWEIRKAIGTGKLTKEILNIIEKR